MIELTSPVGIEPDSEGGGRLILWIGKAFDYSTPFRRAAAEIAEVLGPESARSLQLPPPEEKEDFVEGSLRLGGKLVEIYWEHSLGYLSLMTDDADTFHHVASRIRSIVVQSP